jgi:signal transduction histidine kinase
MHKIEVQSPENKLNNILTTYKNIGISIQTAGSLPHDKALAEIFVAIIREGITNAIRHGHCTKVQIQMLNEHNKNILNITDNGIGCSKSPVFGTGLTGIATRLEAFNGILKIKVQPAFTIHCEVQSNYD